MQSTQRKITDEKKCFILRYGYQAYKKLYYMAKVVDGKIEKLICLSDDDIKKLLK